MSYSPSFVVWYFLILLSVITLFSLFLFFSFSLPVSLLLMILNEDREEKSVFLWFPALCIAVLCLRTCIIVFFSFLFFSFSISTRRIQLIMIMAIQKDLYLEWRKRCYFWKSKFYFFYFFHMGTNDLAWLGLYSDFFFLFLFFVSYITWCCLLNPIQKNKKPQKTTQKKRRDFSINSLLGEERVCWRLEQLVWTCPVISVLLLHRLWYILLIPFPFFFFLFSFFLSFFFFSWLMATNELLTVYHI